MFDQIDNLFLCLEDWEKLRVVFFDVVVIVGVVQWFVGDFEIEFNVIVVGCVYDFVVCVVFQLEINFGDVCFVFDCVGEN